MSFDPLALECFLAVADTASFTRAADKVARTQSAVSQQINKLETLVGKPLFVRAKPLLLTAEGEILLTYARKITQLNREAIDRFRHPELQGEVRFGVPEDFASVFLSDVLTEYAAQHPLILLNIECDLTLNLFERFKQKAFDLVLVKMSRPEDFPNGIDVWSEDLVWVANDEHFSWEDIETVPLVLSPHPCVHRASAISALEEMNKKWRIVFTSDSYAGKVAAVKAGMGLTVLPRNMVPEELVALKGHQQFCNLSDTHISLLKHNDRDEVVNAFERFVIRQLRH